MCCNRDAPLRWVNQILFNKPLKTACCCFTPKCTKYVKQLLSSLNGKKLKNVNRNDTMMTNVLFYKVTVINQVSWGTVVKPKYN